MRITAEIIDEEPYTFDEVFNLITPNVNNNQDSQNRLRVNPVVTANDTSSKQVSFTDHPTFEQCVLQSQRLQEVTQKFKNLHLSEFSSPLKRNDFTLIDTECSSKTMEKATGESTVAAKELDVPPAWLLPYLLKMKHEIKKEVLEEVLHGPQNEIQCVKAGFTCKTEENQFDFQGEVIHTGIFCDNCDQLIHGIRYKCGNCSDFDLCQECESLPNIHNKNHIFLKIRYPVALKLYQKQKWQELMSPVSSKIYMSSRSHQAKKLYEAKFVRDETIPDSTVLPPSTKFVKSWRVVNSGTRVWTHATKLHLIQGSVDLIPSSEHVDVPHLKPGEEGIVSVLFTSPPNPGVYRSHWNFCHKSRPFGDIVWCHIIVKPLEEEKKIVNLTFEKSIPPPNISILTEKVSDNKQNEASCIAQVLTAVKKEHERGNLVPRKLVVTSHTATPNNTPFDLTPPKSPDHHETSIKEVHEISENNSSSSNQAKDSDDDDECSILSLGNSESDTEFVVIPMPKCFNLSESFISQHIPRWIQDGRIDTDNGSKGCDVTETPDVALAESLQSQNAVKKHSLSSKTVSQETGVPELSENTCEQTVVVLENLDANQSMSCLSVVTDGSSSEISIIESQDNSPTVENATQTIETININLSSRELTNQSGENKEIFVAEIPEDSVKVGNQIIQLDVHEEQLVDIPCSTATFPKFPVEGISGTYDPSSVSNEERVIQVLPEGLVTGALSAAASVYNTARAVISTIQQPRNEREACLSRDGPRIDVTHINPPSAPLKPMDQLVEMGFCNRQQNEELLKKHNGDVPLVVAELVNLNDNDWYASRHIPSPPPCFD